MPEKTSYPDEWAARTLNVHCDRCGVTPGVYCVKPDGQVAANLHNNRQANAAVIRRHLKYMEATR